METADPIRNLLSEISTENPGAVAERLKQFSDHLLEVNQKINLVSRQDTKALVQDLILDSLVLLAIVSYDRDARLLDIGSGAGFPGLIQKIARPDLTLISVDSIKKKIEFQRSAAALLALNNCQFLADRIENIAIEPVDYATAKGFGTIDEICRFAKRHLKGGGMLILPRGAKEQISANEVGQGFTLVSRLEYSAGGLAGSAVVQLRRNAEPLSP